MADRLDDPSPDLGRLRWEPVPAVLAYWAGIVALNRANISATVWKFYGAAIERP